MNRTAVSLIVLLLLIPVPGGAQDARDVRRLAPGQKVERALRESETHAYSIALRPGEFLRAEVEQRGVDIELKLRGPSGAELAQVNLLSEFGAEPLSYEAAEAGDYYLEVKAVEAETPGGHYSVTHAVSAHPTQRDRERAAAERSLMKVKSLWQARGAERLREAVAKGEKNVSQWRDLGDEDWLAHALNQLGLLHYDLGEQEKALGYYDQAILSYRAAGDRAGEAQLARRLGKHYAQLGRQQEALKYFNRALALFRTLGARGPEGYTLVDIGRAYDDLGKPRTARKYFDQVLKLSKAAGNTRREAVALTDIGNLYSRRGKWRTSTRYYEQSLPIWRAVGDKDSEALTLHNLGADYQRLGDLQRAADYYNRALPLYQSAQDRGRAIKTLEELVQIHLYWGEKQKAVEAYQQVALLQKAVGDKQGEASTLGHIARVYAGLGETRKSLEAHLLALPLWQAAGNRARAAETLSSIGDAYNELNDYEAAAEYYEQAVPLWRELKDGGREVETLGELGSMYVVLHKNRQALERFGQLLSAVRILGDRRGEAEALYKLGFNHYVLGEKQKAWEHLGQALALIKYPAVSDSLSALLTDGVLIFLVYEDYQDALAYYRQAVSIGRRTGDRRLRAASLTILGRVYSILDDGRNNALDSFQQALSLYRAMGDRNGEATVLTEIGEVYWAGGGELSSIQALLDEIKKPAPNLNLVLQRRDAEIRKAQELFQQALSVYQAVGNRGGQARVLTSIGRTYLALDNNEEALSYCRKALSILEITPDARAEMMVFYALMKIYADLPDPRLAVFFGKRAINLLQDTRALINTLDKGMAESFVRLVGDLYRELADLLFEQGRIAEAEQVLAMLKEEEYFGYLRREDKVAKELLQTASLTEAERLALTRYNEFADRITAIGKEIGQLEAERRKYPRGRFPRRARYDELNGQLRDANKAFEKFLEGLKIELGQKDERVAQIDSSLQTTLGMLKADRTAVVSTIVSKKRLRLVVTTARAQRPHAVDVGEREINMLIAEFRQALMNPKVDPRPAGQKLYDILVKPIEGDLAAINADTIVWSLDGTLRYIPTAALWDKEKGYLMERFASVVITLASRDTLALHPEDRQGWEALGVGVSKPTEGFKALPAVPDELDCIITDPEAKTVSLKPKCESGVLPGKKLLDESFTQSAFEDSLGRFPVVHIASHFQLNPGDDRDSFLLLGGGERKRYTVEDLRLRSLVDVELIVLSACNTATTGGEKANGIEIEGFGVVAQNRGAKAVMASLWEVADDSTRDLMVHFYGLYGTGKVSKAEALRQAQLALFSGQVKGTRAAENEGGTAGRAELAGRAEGGRNLPPFSAAAERPFAHPYFWSPFILMGNWG